jgi:hypothetical protein
MKKFLVKITFSKQKGNTKLTNYLLCSFSEDPSKTVRNAMHMSVHTDSLSILPCDAHHLFSEKCCLDN